MNMNLLIVYLLVMGLTTILTWGLGVYTLVFREKNRTYRILMTLLMLVGFSTL